MSSARLDGLEEGEEKGLKEGILLGRKSEIAEKIRLLHELLGEQPDLSEGLFKNSLEELQIIADTLKRKVLARQSNG